MKKILSAVLATVMLLTILSASAMAEEKLVFGYSKHSVTDPWHQSEVNSILNEAEARGYEVILTDAQGSTEQQVSDIEDLIAQDVDFLIVSPGTEEGYEAVYAKAAEKKIPILQIDRQTTSEEDGVNLIGTVVSNHYQQGFDCGQWLVDSTKNFDALNVVEIQGAPGGSDVALRAQGFRDAIEPDSRINIVASQTGEWSRNTAQNVMQNLIQSLGVDGFNVVYTHNDTMALGAISALKAAGIKIGWDAIDSGEGVLVVTIDGQTEAVESMMDGNINFIAACSPDYSTIFDLIENWYDGVIPDAISYTPDYHFTRENVAEEGYAHAYDYGVN